MTPARPCIQGQAEQCNGIDDDCNGSADYALAPGDLEDDDRDGLPDSRCTPAPATPDCDDRDPSSVPGGTEGCDGRDNDCDGRVDESVTTNVYYIDRDGDGYGSLDAAPMTGCLPISGYVTRAGDCDDASAERRPGRKSAATDATKIAISRSTKHPRRPSARRVPV